MNYILLGLSILAILSAGCVSEPATTAPLQQSPSDSSTQAPGDMGTQSAMASLPVPQAGEYVDLSPVQAKKLIDENPDLVVLDVSPRYAQGHLPGAVNHYIGDGSLDAAIPLLDPAATYLVYCHVDSASIGGAQKLIDAGFTRVYRLEGNYAAWIDAGYPIEQ